MLGILLNHRLPAQSLRSPPLIPLIADEVFEAHSNILQLLIYNQSLFVWHPPFQRHFASSSHHQRVDDSNYVLVHTYV